MSTVPGLPSKGEKGKQKYLALDINSIYKGKSLENPKTSAAPKHGLQSLGKVGAGRRMPPPVNLPSLKSENSGNNPNISLVPSGGQGWGSAGKEKGKSPEENRQVGPQQQSQHSQSPTSHSQGPPVTKQQPSGGAGGGPGGGVGGGVGVKTWSSVTSSQEDGGPERNFLGHQSPFFPQEFPKLAGGDVPTDGTPRLATDAQYGPGPSLRPQMEGTWSRGTLQQQQQQAGQQQGQQQGQMQGGMGPQGCGPPGGLPLSSGSGVNGQASFVGGPQRGGPSQGAPSSGGPASQAQPPYNRQQMGQPFVQAYGRGFPGNYPANFTGMPPGARPPYSYSDGRGRTMRNQPEDDAYQRPAIISEKDLKGFDEILQNDSQDGWAVAKGEIDYNAKLVFRDEEESSGRPSLSGPQQGKPDERGSPKLATSSSKGDGRGLPQGHKAPQALRGREAAWDSAPPQQQQRSRESPQSYLDRPHHGTFGGQPGGPPVVGRGGAPPGGRPLELAGDEEELWRQRRQQQNDEMAVTVERTRQRREEEEKRYEQIKQSSGAAAAATTQKAPPAQVAMGQQEKEELEERSRHSSESREEPPRGGPPLPPLPSSRLDRMDFRQQQPQQQPQQQQQQQAAPPAGGYQPNYQRPFHKNVPPRFLKKAEMQRQQQMQQQQLRQQQQGGGTGGALSQAPSSLPPGGGGGMVGVNFDPRWAAMGAPAAYLSQLGMGPQLKGAAVAEVAPYPPEAGERPYEARGEGGVAPPPPRPPSMECWASARPLGDRPGPPPQAAPPPLAPPPHVPPGERVSRENGVQYTSYTRLCSESPSQGSRGYRLELAQPLRFVHANKVRQSIDETHIAANSASRSTRQGSLGAPDFLLLTAHPAMAEIHFEKMASESSGHFSSIKMTHESSPRYCFGAHWPERLIYYLGNHNLIPMNARHLFQTVNFPVDRPKSPKMTEHTGYYAFTSLGDPSSDNRNLIPMNARYLFQTVNFTVDRPKSPMMTERTVNKTSRKMRRAIEAERWLITKMHSSEQTMQAEESEGDGGPGALGANGRLGFPRARALANRGLASVHFKNRAHARTTRRTPFTKAAKERARTQLQNKTKMAAVVQMHREWRSREVGVLRLAPRPIDSIAGLQEVCSFFTQLGNRSLAGALVAMTSGWTSLPRDPRRKRSPLTIAPVGTPSGSECRSDRALEAASSPANQYPVFCRLTPLSARSSQRECNRVGAAGRGNKEALSDVGNEDWETASESSDVADRRGPNDEGKRAAEPPKKPVGGTQPPAATKQPPGGQQERPARRPGGGEPRRGGGGGGSGGGGSERNGRAPHTQRRGDPGPHQQPRLGGGGGRGRQGGAGGGGRARGQPPRSGDAGGSSPRGDPATLVYRVDEVKLQDPGNVQAALSDLGSRKHLKKTDPLQQNGRIEKEKPNALEGIDLSNYAGVVVIDDNPGVTDHSFGDGDDGDFQEVTSKKRHRLLADGDAKKLRKEPARNKTAVHGRQNKLPPRLIKKRESDRLFSTKTDAPTQKERLRAPAPRLECARKESGVSLAFLAEPAAAVSRPPPNAWEKPITHALRGMTASPPSTGVPVPPAAVAPPAPAEVLVSSKSSSFDRGSDQHDSGIDVSDQPPSAASSQRSSPSNDGKGLDRGSRGIAKLSLAVFVLQTVGLDSGKPMGTVIFENKNFKAENAALDKFEIQTKTQVEQIAANGPVLTPVASKDCKEPLESGKPKVQMAGEDTTDMKLDFTFDPELAQFGEDKSAKHMAIPRSLSSEMVGSPMSPSTDELNLKIASVKKVWETVGPLSTVLEHGAASGEEVGTAPGSGTGATFGTFGAGPPSSEGSFATPGARQKQDRLHHCLWARTSFSRASSLRGEPSADSSQQLHQQHQQHQQQQQQHHQHQQHQHQQQQLHQQQQQHHQQQSHSMLDQSLHKVKSAQGMQHTLSPPPTGAASSSSLAGVDVRAMNLQVAGMPQAVPSPPTAALLFSGAQQMPQPAAGLYQTLLPDPVSRPVAQFSQGAHGYPPMASYQGFGQGGVFVPPPAHPAHSAQDLFAAGAALRLQPTYQTQHVPTSQVLSQQGLQTQQLLGSQVGRGPPGGHLGTSYYSGPTQGGYYQASQQQPPPPLASVFGSQSLTAFRNFHPSFKSLDLTAAAGAAGAQPSGQEFCPSPVGGPPQASKMPSVTSGSAQQKAMQAHFAAAFGQQQGASAGVRGAPMHVVQLPSGVVPKYPAPIQRPQQQQAAPTMAPPPLMAPQQRGLPPTSLRGQPPPRQLPTSDQQAKQRAEAVKQAQLFFAQSKPSPTCNPSEEGKGPSPPPPLLGSGPNNTNAAATVSTAADSKDEDNKSAPAKEAPLEE
ncbi:unnamed protein product [Ixodes hexagonus]